MVLALSIMSTSLEQIIASVRKRVEAAKAALPLNEIAKQAYSFARPIRGFRRALESAPDGISVIAELKKGSPSRGVIREDFPVTALARRLEESGAAALSIVTEEDHFLGSLENLAAASATTRLPCLRKDFIIDEYQLYQARLHSADAVLLIAAVLNPAKFQALYIRASELQLEVLCEIHDESEMEMVAEFGVDIVGVNSRNLRTLEVDTRLHVELARLLPNSMLKVAESGVNSGQQMRKLKVLGYQAFLIGETLMKADDPGTALAQLLSEAREGIRGMSTSDEGSSL